MGKRVDAAELFIAHAQRVELARQLTDIQKAAMDLYRRGFNVFPLPSAIEWRASGKTDKHPYGRTGKLFYTRLHYCPEASCHHMGRNAGADFPSLFQATGNGAPNLGVMAGVTSGNLLIIDCDSKSAFQFVLSELTRRNIPFWAITSHRGGACLIRVLEGEIRNAPKAKSKLPDVELWGRSHYAVMPPSIHPTGTQYEWYTPNPSASLLDDTATLPPVSISLLDWLGAELHSQRAVNELPALPDNLPSELRCLSQKNQLTWANGSKDGTRNLDAFNIACDLKGNGFSKARALAYLQEFAARCDPPLPESELKARVKSAFRKSRTRARDSVASHAGKDNIRYEWQAAQAFADSLDWRGKFGRKSLKARAVFQACIERARMSHSRVWRASERELSELANLHRHNVRTYLRSFIALKLLARPETDKFVTGGASLFLFGEGVRIATSNITCTTTGSNSDTLKIPKTDAERDVFGAMRGCAWAVYRHLLANPEQTKSAVARAIGQPRSSVSAALSQLIGAGLVSAAEGAFISLPVFEHTLLQVTVNGKPIKERSRTRREKHKREREINANVDMARAIRRYREKQRDKQGNHKQR